MRTVYDAGALIAADRDARGFWTDHKFRLSIGVVPVTTAPIVAQVSRSTRQVRLRRLLKACEVVPFAADDAHSVGALLAGARTSDVVDAHLMHVAAGSEIFTSDPRDLEALAVHVSPRPLIRNV